MNIHTAICIWMSEKYNLNRPSFHVIYEIIERVMHVSEQQIKGNDRHESILEGRHAFIWICIRLLGYSTVDTGRELNKHHTSIMNATKSFDNRFYTNHNQIQDKIDKVKELLEKDETIGTKNKTTDS